MVSSVYLREHLQIRGDYSYAISDKKLHTNCWRGDKQFKKKQQWNKSNIADLWPSVVSSEVVEELSVLYHLLEALGPLLLSLPCNSINKYFSYVYEHNIKDWQVKLRWQNKNLVSALWPRYSWASLNRFHHIRSCVIIRGTRHCWKQKIICNIM